MTLCSTFPAGLKKTCLPTGFMILSFNTQTSNNNKHMYIYIYLIYHIYHIYISYNNMPYIYSIYIYIAYIIYMICHIYNMIISMTKMIIALWKHRCLHDLHVAGCHGAPSRLERIPSPDWLKESHHQKW